jgi:hypothetical protein
VAISSTSTHNPKKKNHCIVLCHMQPWVLAQTWLL